MKSLSDNDIRCILEESKTIAIVGASAKPDRDSYMIMQFLQQHGYNVVPVNPVYKEIAGLKCYSGLRDIPEKIDIVDIFRKSEDVLPIVNDAIAVNAKTVWMQLGVVNEDAAQAASMAGINVIMNRCIKIDFIRLISR